MSHSHTYPRINGEQAPAPARPWPRPSLWLVAILLVAVLTLLYWGILRDMSVQWRDDDNYNHGFLIPVFSGFLLWRERHRLRALEASGRWVGLLVLLGGIAILLLGDIGAENFLMRSSLLVILAGLVLFLAGRVMLRATLFPLCYLLFMIPLPAILLYAVTFPLQRVAAEQAAWVLDLLGVPVLLDGNVIHLSQITLGVTEACSGIRSLIALLAGAVAWAYLMLPVGWLSVVFVVSAIPITIIANSVRVVATGLIGQWFGVEYASGFFHEFAGWVVYLFAFTCLMGVYSLVQLVNRWRRRARA
jgi:exosortase